jgi:hypothetical protein
MCHGKGLFPAGGQQPVDRTHKGEVGSAHVGSAAVLVTLLLVGATWATVLWPLARQALGIASAAG